MTDKETCGFAFPIENHAKTQQYGSFGMTLRDYFAAKAMQGLISAWSHGVPESSAIAKAAYQYADSMMEARK